VAVNLHGAERLTLDVDLMLALDAENLRRFFLVAKRLVLRPVLPVTLEQFFDAKAVQSWIRDKRMLAFQLRFPDARAPSIDILVKPLVPFEPAYGRRATMRVEEVAIDVAAAEDLIALKSGTGRLIDKSDVQALYRLDELKRRRCDD
jgi:hypothetical protein